MQPPTLRTTDASRPATISLFIANNTIRAADRRIRTPIERAQPNAPRSARPGERAPRCPNTVGSADPLIRTPHSRSDRIETIPAAEAERFDATADASNRRRFAPTHNFPLQRVQHDSRGGSEDPHPHRTRAVGSERRGERAPWGASAEGSADPLIRMPHSRSDRIETIPVAEAELFDATADASNRRRFAPTHNFPLQRVQHDSRGGSEDPHPHRTRAAERAEERAPWGASAEVSEHRGERGSSDPHATLAFRSDRDHPCGRSGAVRCNRRRFAPSHNFPLQRVQHDSRGGSEDPHPHRTRAAERTDASRPATTSLFIAPDRGYRERAPAEARLTKSAKQTIYL